MTAEKIIEHIQKDAENERKQILKEAERQANDIIAQAEKEAKAQAKRILEDGKKHADNTEKILLSQAHQEAKRKILQAKETIIDECFTKAHHELSVLDEKRYNIIVKKRMSEGKRKLGNQCSVFVSRASDRQVAKELGLHVEGTIEKAGGVVLQSADGNIVLDYSFDGILKREKDTLRITVGTLLFSS
ncbi:MAG: V-type ATP synthase subunit E [Candidatus Thermoplasmatota archaeon]|nr:V-type ATP synthase subunit E [Candidatus Thermoplasmatota archaeon]